MATIAIRARGRLLNDRDHAAFLLRAEDGPYVLRLGFAVRGSEEVILPESLLDDWGHEISSLELYAWVRDNGMHFPRAEIFGFDPNGRPTQCFIRETDLTAGYACFAYRSANAPLASGVRLGAILLYKANLNQPQRLQSPPGIAPPLSEANVQWWLVGEFEDKAPDLSFLGVSADLQSG